MLADWKKKENVSLSYKSNIHEWFINMYTNVYMTWNLQSHQLAFIPVVLQQGLSVDKGKS